MSFNFFSVYLEETKLKVLYQIIRTRSSRPEAAQFKRLRRFRRLCDTKSSSEASIDCAYLLITESTKGFTPGFRQLEVNQRRRRSTPVLRQPVVNHRRRSTPVFRQPDVNHRRRRSTPVFRPPAAMQQRRFH